MLHTDSQPLLATWETSVVGSLLPLPDLCSVKFMWLCPRWGSCSLWQDFLFPIFSHTSKVMFKILQARLQQYVNRELQMFKLDLEKAEESDWIANICWIIEKAREFQKNFCFIDYAKATDCVDHNKRWKILRQMGIPDHLICLLRNLYAGQEATVRTGHGTTDWFQIGKGVRQGCILSHCLFNLYAEHIMRNDGLD